MCGGGKRRISKAVTRRFALGLHQERSSALDDGVKARLDRIELPKEGEIFDLNWKLLWIALNVLHPSAKPCRYRIQRLGR